jgi:hypothetical protein
MKGSDRDVMIGLQRLGPCHYASGDGHDPNGRQGEGRFVNRNALLEKCNEIVGVAIALKYDLPDQLD